MCLCQMQRLGVVAYSSYPLLALQYQSFKKTVPSNDKMYVLYFSAEVIRQRNNTMF